MLHSTNFPVGGIDEQMLRDFVNHLSRLSGKRIDIDTQIIVSTDDINLNGILENLADTIREGAPVTKAKPLKKGRTPKIKLKKVMGGG